MRCGVKSLSNSESEWVNESEWVRLCMWVFWDSRTKCELSLGNYEQHRVFNVWVKAWMNEWASDQVNDWMSEWMGEWVRLCTSVCRTVGIDARIMNSIECSMWVKAWMNEWVSDQVNDWISEWMGDWVSEWVSEVMYVNFWDSSTKWDHNQISNIGGTIYQTLNVSWLFS